ncbi:MAG: PIN domain-containing protein [Gemmataceae bacterium]
MTGPIVLYDACILFSAQLRDLFMRLTLSDLCAARWTEEILEEWSRNLIAKNPNITAASVARCRALMNQHAADALVTGYEHRIPGLSLPDPDDRHVLAAAIHCRAKVIVTFNLKDFPEEMLSPHGIEAIHPDEFLTRLLQRDLQAICETLRLQRAELINPPISADSFLNRLERMGLIQSVAILRTVADLF